MKETSEPGRRSAGSGVSAPGAQEPAARALPSDAELKVLRDLWVHGECTVREVHDRVSRDWPVGYTTVLTLLQRLFQKGLVTRSEADRAHRYRAATSRERTRRHMAHDLVERVFDGSIVDLVAAALPAGGASEEELEQIRRVLDRAR